MGAKAGDKLKNFREWIREGHLANSSCLYVTCREDEYKQYDLHIDTMRLSPLEAEQIESISSVYLGDDSSAFLQQIGGSAGFWSNAKNPYLLMALMVLFATSNNKELPKSAGRLYLNLIRQLWERERRRQTLGWIDFSSVETSVAGLAFDMIRNGNRVAISVEEALERVTRDTINVGVSANIFILEGGQLRFSHQLMQESAAAIALRFQEGNVSEIIQGLAFNGRSAMHYRPTTRAATRWDQPVIAACDLSGDWDRWVLGVARSDPILGARCARLGEENDGRRLRAETAAEVILCFERWIGVQRERSAKEWETSLEYQNRYGGYYSNRGAEEHGERSEVEKEGAEIISGEMKAFGKGYLDMLSGVVKAADAQDKQKMDRFT